jgi:hypothetical protein
MALSAFAIIALTAIIALVPFRPQGTDASWTDDEYSHAALAGAVIAPPTIDTCSYALPFLAPNAIVTITWKFPAGTYAAPGNVAYATARGGIASTQTAVVPGSTLATTGPVGGEYTTQFKNIPAPDFIGGMAYGIFIQTVDGSGWNSVKASAGVSTGPLGLSPRCTIT